MSFLSNLFGGDDSDSSNGSASDLTGDLDAVLSIDASNVSYSEEVDEDGSSETTYDATSFGTDLDLGGMIDSMTQNFSEVDG